MLLYIPKNYANKIYKFKEFGVIVKMVKRTVSIGLDYGEVNCGIAIINESDNSIMKISLLNFNYNEPQPRLIDNLSNKIANTLFNIFQILIRKGFYINLKIEKGLFGSYAIPRALRYGEMIGALKHLMINAGYYNELIINDNIMPSQWRKYHNFPTKKEKGRTIKKLVINRFNEKVINQIPEYDCFGIKSPNLKKLTIKDSHLAEAYYIAITE